MSIFPGPHPRYRLYTSNASYLWLLRDLLAGRFNEGDSTQELEASVSQMMGVSNAICMPQARVGLYFAIKSVIKPGQRVIMSPYTIADVVNMVLAAGGRPTFAELEPGTCNADPKDIEMLLDRHRDVGAVMITHLHGLANHPLQIRELCDAYDVPLIEDAAQSFGGVFEGRRLGTFGNIGVFSLGTYKNINAWYGGIVVTANDLIAQQIREEIGLFSQTQPAKVLRRAKQGLMTDVLTAPVVFRMITFWIFRLGMLSDINWINRRVNTELDLSRRDVFPEAYRQRLSELQARLAMRQLGSIDNHTDERIIRAVRYLDVMGNVPEIQTPPRRTDRSHLYTFLPVQVPNRQKTLKWMMQHGRDCSAQHLRNCADLASFSEFHRELPVARNTAESTILLPTYPRYPLAEVVQSAETLKRMYV